MQYVYLGKENITSMNDVHEAFAEALDFPDYYGENLDALYDCLGDIFEEVLIIIADAELLGDALGERFDSLVELLDDICEENSNITVRYVE